MQQPNDLFWCVDKAKHMVVSAQQEKNHNIKYKINDAAQDGGCLARQCLTRFENNGGKTQSRGTRFILLGNLFTETFY